MRDDLEIHKEKMREYNQSILKDYDEDEDPYF